MPRIPLIFLCLCAIAVFSPASGRVAYGQWIIAHRGASHDAPENTLAAFRLAFEKGADGIEGDFHLTRDKRIVCIHDRDTGRVASEMLVVAKSTLAELQRLDVGRWKGDRWSGERIPTLEEVIDVIPKGKKIFIELKTGSGIVEPLKELLDRSTIQPEQIVLISFHADTLAACEKQIPGVTSQWLFSHKKTQGNDSWSPSADEITATLNKIGADGFGGKARRAAFGPNFVRQLKRAGFVTFHVWTVDDAKTARYYQRLGAAGITTNRPASIRKAIAETPATDVIHP